MPTRVVIIGSTCGVHRGELDAEGDGPRRRLMRWPIWLERAYGGEGRVHIGLRVDDGRPEAQI